MTKTSNPNRRVLDSPAGRFHLFLLAAFFFICPAMPMASAQTGDSSFPRDQVALQLGAIQMGYTSPFVIVSGNATKAQQAANALVMGRNALDAAPGVAPVLVQGVSSSPLNNTVAFRDQLYEAVEAVVSSPASGSVNGTVTTNGTPSQTSVSATLAPPPTSYTVPVPFALESRSSVDAIALSSNVTAVQTLANGLSSNLTTLTSQTTNLTTQTQALSTNVSTVQGQTASLAGNVSGMQEQLASSGIGDPIYVITLAGSGNATFADGIGTAASFYHPEGVAVDAAGNVYVADSVNHRIRKITPAGVVTTLAGSGNGTFANGTGTAASFKQPVDVAVDSSGNVYVADMMNCRIRKITPAGVVTTLAGSGNFSFADGTGTAASFNYPSGVAVDAGGNVYVADRQNNRIRKITPAGVVTTLAGSGDYGSINGTGTAASFAFPVSVAVDSSGNVYVADSDSSRIRKITAAGVVTTLAGTGNNGYADGMGTAAAFSDPDGLAVDGAGNIYVADFGNARIRKITPGGLVTTLAGGNGIFADAPGASAGVVPSGVAVDSEGHLVVSDQGYHRVRKVVPMVQGLETKLAALQNLVAANAAIVEANAQPLMEMYQKMRYIQLWGNLEFGSNATAVQSRTLRISNFGFHDLGITNILCPPGFSVNWTSASISSESFKDLIVTFTPGSLGNYTGNITVVSNALGGASVIENTANGETSYTQLPVAPGVFPVQGAGTKAVTLSGDLIFHSSSGAITKNMTIANTGSMNLTVTGISYPTGFSGNWTSGSLKLTPGQTRSVAVTFSPTLSVTQSGNIMVTSDATGGPKSIAVSGTGARTISVSGNLNFGHFTAGPGLEFTRTFGITNLGTMSLTVSGISYPAGFSGNWSGGTLLPGITRNVTVSFKPTAVQTYGGNISVASNATGGSGTIPVPANSPLNYFVNVGGGTLANNPYQGATVPAFRIGRHEVTWSEWQHVRTWAVSNGYTDLSGKGSGLSPAHPVTHVGWEDVLKWCNAKSEMEGLIPVYRTQFGSLPIVLRTGSPTNKTVEVLGTANGYRLPTGPEWVWAARGAGQSKGYTYSGSNDPYAVGWYFLNSSPAAPSRVMGNLANELGIRDMSGNVRELAFDTLVYSTFGGSYSETPQSLDFGDPDYNVGVLTSAPNIGFRLARNAAP